MDQLVRREVVLGTAVSTSVPLAGPPSAVKSVGMLLDTITQALAADDHLVERRHPAVDGAERGDRLVVLIDHDVLAAGDRARVVVDALRHQLRAGLPLYVWVVRLLATTFVGTGLNHTGWP